VAAVAVRPVRRGSSTYPVVVVQGRSVLLQRVTAHSSTVTSAGAGVTYPGVVVQGRSVSLQKASAHSSTVTGAVADLTYPGVVVQGRSVSLQKAHPLKPSVASAVTSDLPCSADFERLWRRERASDRRKISTGRKSRISSSLPYVAWLERSPGLRHVFP
jgi:hypothetical protein